MKKITSLLTLLIMFLGAAFAQNTPMHGWHTYCTNFNRDEPQPHDVYFAGYGDGVGKIWKNDSVVVNIPDTAFVNLMALQIASDGSLYTAGFTIDSTLEQMQGHIWRNDSVLFSSQSNSTIADLVTNENGWTAVGNGENEWGNGIGLVWQNGELLYCYNDSINSITISTLAIDQATGDVYAGGSIGGTFDSQAIVWKNDSVFWHFPLVSIVNDLAFDGGNLYVAGVLYNEGIRPTLWQNDSIVFQINETDADLSEFSSVALYDGSIYLSGFIDTTLYVWRDGEVLYSHQCATQSEINRLVVNEFGVFYSGFIDGVATVWKDGEILYQPEECDAINAICVQAAPPQPTYTLTVEANNAAWGNVTGGGMYHYGDTVTIEAIANTGHEFLFWNDSIADNPREFVITHDTTFIAHFGQLEYVIETLASPENTGVVTGGGTYHYGDTATIEAIANTGYKFMHWNDSITDNPREIVVTQDSIFTAFFAERQYTISVVSDHPSWGSVTGGGTYNYGDTIYIAATPNLGFAFVKWTDGNTDNPREIIVTDDATYIAHFDVRQCEIRVNVSPAGAGTVDGEGVYNYGETIRLTVHNNQGYVFDVWDDGNITNPRIVLVEGDATYTAVFKPLQYEITTEASPEAGGTVRGAGMYDYGTTASLKADPNEGYMFISWHDGIMTNPRNVTVTQNAHYKALFYLVGTPEYTITVLANDPELGTVTGSGTYPENTSIEISAVPVSGAIFEGWHDGNTDNPRTVVVTADTTFKAIFSRVETYSITVRPDSPFLGSTYGSGTYPAGTLVNIGAIPNSGFYFSGWQDGNADNPRSILVTQNAEYVAYFSQEPTLTYTVTVYCDEDQGFVLGAGTYTAGATATLVAIPADGYEFAKWSDEVTDNRRDIVVNQDIILAVFFKQTGLNDSHLATISLYPNPANDQIRIEGLEGENEIQIFNTTGRLVKTAKLSDSEPLNVSDLSAGLYLIRINETYELKFMKE